MSLLDRVHFEVFPADGAEERVAAQLPAGAPVHVMCPPQQGAERSLLVAERIAATGRPVLPHLSARTVRGRAHLDELLGRVAEAEMAGIFVPGGDGPVGPGCYDSAVALLADLQPGEVRGEVGVGAYPEGHKDIDDATLLSALASKQRVATFMSSQNCFDAGRLVAWLRGVRDQGIRLPLLIGVPGPVRVRTLLRAMKQFGLGEAHRYLRAQNGMLAALAGRRFSPDPLLDALGAAAQEPALGVAGLHVFTFDDLAAARRWLDASTSGRSGFDSADKARRGPTN